MKRLWFCMVLVLGAACAQAEMRMWTDGGGKQFKAEFVRELFDVVYLTTPKGEFLSIDVDKLSSGDLVYVRTMIPPEITFSFTRTTRAKERSNYARPDDKIDIITGTFTFEKERDPSYQGVLTATVFMIGQEINPPDVYVLLNKSRESFTLTRQDKEIHAFDVSVEARRYQEYNTEVRGTEFVGYVVVVEDPAGNVFFHESNLKWMTEDKIETLCKFRSRTFFNKECRTVPVPRPNYYTGRAFFAQSKLKSAE